MGSSSSRHASSTSTSTWSRRSTKNHHASSNQDRRNTREASRVEPVKSNRVNPTTPQERHFADLTIGQNVAEKHEPPKSRSGNKMFPCGTCIVKAQISEEPCNGKARISEEEPKGSEIIPLPIDEELCPICLEGYSLENPKLSIQCKHDYHLCCILEWMERSCLCPICSQVMILD